MDRRGEETAYAPRKDDYRGVSDRGYGGSSSGRDDRRREEPRRDDRYGEPRRDDRRREEPRRDDRDRYEPRREERRDDRYGGGSRGGRDYGGGSRGGRDDYRRGEDRRGGDDRRVGGGDSYAHREEPRRDDRREEPRRDDRRDYARRDNMDVDRRGGSSAAPAYGGGPPPEGGPATIADFGWDIKVNVGSWDDYHPHGRDGKPVVGAAGGDNKRGRSNSPSPARKLTRAE